MAARLAKRSLATLLGGMFALAAPAPSNADSGGLRQRFRAVGEQRAIAGTGSVAGMGLAITGAGAELRLARTLAARGQLLGLLTAGKGDAGEPAEGGLGGELSLRLEPWPDARVRPYLRWGLGLMLFREPFLPGGTRYDGIISFGGGLEIDVTESLALGIDGFSVHLSNGQGLGEHNPAYDGVGVALAAAWTFDPAGAEAFIANQRTLALAPERTSARPGATAQASVGGVDGNVLATVAVTAVTRVGPRVLAQVEVEAGTFADDSLIEGAAAAVWRPARLAIGVRGGYRRFGGLPSWLAAAQVEYRATPEISLLVAGQVDAIHALDDVWRAAVGARAFVAPGAVVDLGYGFDRIGLDTIDADRGDPYLRGEWMLPLGLDDWQVSLFVERQVSTLNLIGLRTSFGVGDSLRARDRANSWRLVR